MKKSRTIIRLEKEIAHQKRLSRNLKTWADIMEISRNNWMNKYFNLLHWSTGLFILICIAGAIIFTNATCQDDFNIGLDLGYARGYDDAFVRYDNAPVFVSIEWMVNRPDGDVFVSSLNRSVPFYKYVSNGVWKNE